MNGKPNKSRSSTGNKDQDVVTHLHEGAHLFKELGDTLEAAAAIIEEKDHSLNLRWRADMRAIHRWRMQNPSERDMFSPDHADLCMWLMERIKSIEDLVISRDNGHDGCRICKGSALMGEVISHWEWCPVKDIPPRPRDFEKWPEAEKARRNRR